jgi:ArsR family transcriptional regulator, arsenate/arsenite/antimonite-responsive transcriptional repressor
MKLQSLDVRPTTQLLKAIADETRLRIVALLAHGELCVCHVQDALELSQPNASRQLGILRSAGVIDQRRDGNWMFYRLTEQADEDRRRLLKAVVSGFAQQEVLRRDVAKLLKVSGPGRCQ